MNWEIEDKHENCSEQSWEGVTKTEKKIADELVGENQSETKGD